MNYATRYFICTLDKCDKFIELRLKDLSGNILWEREFSSDDSDLAALAYEKLCDTAKEGTITILDGLVECESLS